MAKITKVNGHRYSLEDFDGREIRYQIQYEIPNEKAYKMFDVFTDNMDSEKVLKMFTERILTQNKEAYNIVIFSKKTKEQDQQTIDFLDKLFNIR